MIFDLPSLLHPVDEATFLQHFIEKRRLHVRTSERGRAAGLLPWATVNHLIECDVLPPDRLRVIRANIDVATLMYRRRDEHKHLRAGALQQLLAQGASVIINDVSDLVPAIGGLSDNIERRLGHRVGVNAYLSFGRGSAFKAHFDYHDVLVLQVHGRKRWRSHGTPFPSPVEQLEPEPGKEAPPEIAWEEVLEPGDLLYLPRGEVHEAAVEGPNSVHLTIGIHIRHGVHLFEWLRKRAALDPEIRKDLTRAAGTEALRRHEATLKERLHAIVDAASVEEFLSAEDAEPFEGAKVMVYPNADERDPQMFLVEAQARDGFVYALLADGSIQGFSPQRLEEFRKSTGQPDGAANGRQPFSSETNRTSAAASTRRSP